MLVQLRDYIKKQRTVSISQLAREFATDASAIEPMLEIWVRKGLITKHQHPLACKSGICNACKPDSEIYYSWVV